MAAVYSQHRLGDHPGNMLFPDDVLQTVVEQLVASYLSEKLVVPHSPEAAVAYAARDIARLAQGSKALHTTSMAAWHHLSQLVETRMHSNRLRYPVLPKVPGLCWVRCFPAYTPPAD